MPRLRIVVVLVVLCTAPLAAADGSPESGEEVVEEITRLTTVEWPRANLAGDTAWFERHLADELVVTTGRTGEVTGKAEELAAVRASGGSGGGETIDDLRIRVFDDVAVSTFRIDVTGTDDTGPYHRIARYTEVWVLRDGRWQLAASHSSLLPRQPEAGPSGESGAAARVAPVQIPVREDGVVGTLVVPDTVRPYPGVLRIGGGEGGISVGDAKTIAAAGYAVLALAYFGAEGLPADLEEVPLESFGKAIAWMKGSPHVDPSRLAIVGMSRGSIPALWVPTLYHDFAAVVAIAPSHVTWQSHYLDWDRYAEKSSHTWGGEPLPFVPYDFSNEAALEGCNAEEAACVKMYEHSLGQLDCVREALIPVERIRAPILLLSGAADSMWPSSAMANRVIERLDAHRFPFEHRHVAFEDAGHCGLNRCYDHQPRAGDEAAVEGTRRELFQFLDRHLAPR